MKYQIRIKITLAIAALLMISYMCVKIAILSGLRESTETTRWIEFFGVISLIPISILLIKDFINSTKDSVSKDSVDKMIDLENFLDSSAIISKADKHGKITYVNEKFTEVSGYSLEEVISKDHNIVNSGTHPKEFWTDMYHTVVKEKKIWNSVCTNRTKDGSLYYVDTFIKCEFDEKDNLQGFMSIRQDVTEIKRKEIEISNRMNAINRSNAVIEFDLEGNIKFANDLFLATMDYTNDEIIGKHHSIFVEDGLKDTDEYLNFWKTLGKGEFFRG